MKHLDTVMNRHNVRIPRCPLLLRWEYVLVLLLAMAMASLAIDEAIVEDNNNNNNEDITQDNMITVKSSRKLSDGCQTCATTGMCNAAYHNGPGRYCGSWYDVSSSTSKPCCCPYYFPTTTTLPNGRGSTTQNAAVTCNVAPTQCKCHVEATNTRPTNDNYYHSTNDDYYHPTNSNALDNNKHSWLFILASLVILCCCCWDCHVRSQSHQNNKPHSPPSPPHHPPPPPHSHHPPHQEHIPIATACAVPNPHAPGYGATAPPYNPSYTPSAGSNGGNGNAILAGLGGLVTGTFLGEWIERSHGNYGFNSNSHDIGTNNAAGFGGFGGFGRSDGNGGNGGFDIVGDSGGDTGGGDFGGFDIAGDS